ncbi:MAG: ABC transporter [Alteromonadaceae bacterium]|uniref:ABC transporter ATP-binding protein n=1 Tax=Paraglaciecola chathamensis TaxID=368405 RepID=UPI000C3F2E28|nr:ABC transporter ATP-binding protein [Paraglaciecola agarilytica]MBN26411.1 ABC transporter [Alteromonadaceae bacterium]|tara:strand:+ start:57012 stop:58799 length:1788 start_codon:yes stop_codon:yes gene_type:complete
MTAHIIVEHLYVEAGPTEQPVTIVDDVSFSLQRGEVLALIGESGSGKTTIALTLLGYARPGCRIIGGSVMVGKDNMADKAESQLAGLRGRKVAYVAQSAAAAFNPSRRIMDQVVESALMHGLMTRKEAEAKAVTLFANLSLPSPETIGRRYPHEVSGGQLQRLMAAMALICDPELVIFDEPTTALDVTTQVDVLKAFKVAVKATNTTAVYVSHDLAVVAQMADRILVLQRGRVMENNPTDRILNDAEHPYTRQLLNAVQNNDTVQNKEHSDVVLDIGDIEAGYGKITKAGKPEIPILSGISLKVRRGQTVGIIGESGSGKSTFARVIAGLLPASAGYMVLNNQELPPAIADRGKRECQHIQMVFQNADTALNPSHKVADILGRPLTFFHGLKGEAQKERVAELLELVKLPVALADRKCGALSGGQKQRINLARALAAEPSVILCDEVTSALDTVVAAAILDLLEELQARLNIAIVFISHDISTVKSLCDEVLVLYKGKKVEHGSGSSFACAPYHPYTDLLVSSVPTLDPKWLDSRKRDLDALDISVQNTDDLCRFRDRCPVKLGDQCNTEAPPLRTLTSGKSVLCHRDQAMLVAQ